MTTLRILCFFCSFVFVVPASAAPPILDWTLIPEYVLGQNATNSLVQSVRYPVMSKSEHAVAPPQVQMKGLVPTERHWGLVSSKAIPEAAFTIEMWVCCHVDQPVVTLI